MNLSSFNELLQAARAQPQPQRLLFVFAGVELPDDSTHEQGVRFAAGQGGALVPLMVVDKDAGALLDFEALARESEHLAEDWQMVFAAALSGRHGQAPSSADCELPLQRMVQAIREGSHGAYIPFDRQGQPLLFE